MAPWRSIVAVVHPMQCRLSKQSGMEFPSSSTDLNSDDFLWFEAGLQQLMIRAARGIEVGVWLRAVEVEINK